MHAAILTPSAPFNHTEQRRTQFESGLANLHAHGIKTTLMPHALAAESYVSSSTQNRLADLTEAYTNPEYDLILTGNGGWNSGELLSAFPWHLAQSTGKRLVGFSDISALLNAIYARTGQIQLHGPMVAWGFHQNDPLTWQSFQAAVSRQLQTCALDAFGRFLQGSSLQPSPLCGGNLITLATLLGTPYCPDFTGKILFLEETEETIFRLARALTHLKNAGIFSELSGLIIGHLDQIDEQFAGKTHPKQELIREFFQSYTFPILQTSLFGHNTKTQLTLPIGGLFSAQNGQICIES